MVQSITEFLHYRIPAGKKCRKPAETEFNNWSPYLVKDPDTVWIGLEYFCSEGDALWNLPRAEMIEFAVQEMEHIDFIRKQDIIDSVCIYMPKAYPAYFGSYKDFPFIREFTDSIANLYLIGRNGMHRYNNADHSMLSAMTAVDMIAAGKTDKSCIWEVNTESKYQEKR